MADTEKCTFFTNQKEPIARGKLFRRSGREVKHGMYLKK